jgi:hypothetical protein
MLFSTSFKFYLELNFKKDWERKWFCLLFEKPLFDRHGGTHEHSQHSGSGAVLSQIRGHCHYIVRLSQNKTKQYSHQNPPFLFLQKIKCWFHSMQIFSSILKFSQLWMNIINKIKWIVCFHAYVKDTHI